MSQPESQIIFLLSGYVGEMALAAGLIGLGLLLKNRFSPALSAAGIGILSALSLSLYLDSKTAGSDFESATRYFKDYGFGIYKNALSNFTYTSSAILASLPVASKLKEHF